MRAPRRRRRSRSDPDVGPERTTGPPRALAVVLARGARGSDASGEQMAVRTRVEVRERDELCVHSGGLQRARAEREDRHHHVLRRARGRPGVLPSDGVEPRGQRERVDLLPHEERGEGGQTHAREEQLPRHERVAQRLRRQRVLLDEQLAASRVWSCASSAPHASRTGERCRCGTAIASASPAYRVKKSLALCCRDHSSCARGPTRNERPAFGSRAHSALQDAKLEASRGRQTGRNMTHFVELFSRLRTGLELNPEVAVGNRRLDRNVVGENGRRCAAALPVDSHTARDRRAAQAARAIGS